MFTSEIILRAIDENTGKLDKPELISYEFSGKTYENQPKNLAVQEGILCLPNWGIFIEDSQYNQWSLIARKYTAEPCREHYDFNPKFNRTDYGNVVFAVNKEYGHSMIKEHSKPEKNSSLFDEIKLEPPSISHRFRRRYDF